MLLNFIWVFESKVSEKQGMYAIFFEICSHLVFLYLHAKTLNKDAMSPCKFIKIKGEEFTNKLKMYFSSKKHAHMLVQNGSVRAKIGGALILMGTCIKLNNTCKGGKYYLNKKDRVDPR